MQLRTVVTLLVNLAHTIRHRTWEFNEAQGRASFWCDLPPNDDMRLSIAATINRHQDRVDDEILPAVDDLLQSTAGAYEADLEYVTARRELEAVIIKWRLVAGPVRGIKEPPADGATTAASIGEDA